MAFFSQNGIAVEVRDVTASSQNMQRMAEISGQSKTPTLEFGEFIVADFSVDEFIDAIEQVPDVKQQLGFTND